MNDPVVLPDDQALQVAPPVATDAAASNPSQGPGAPQKSPLDLLEEMLGNTNEGVTPGASNDAPPEPPPGPTQEEVDAIGAQQTLVDQAEAQAKLDEIHQEIEGVKHQDQLHTEQAAHQQTEDKTDAQAGFQINQVGHTKIEENPG